MATSGKLGIYWGVNNFSVVETINGQISNILQIPFDTAIEQDGNEDQIPDELKFPAILKKTLEFRSIKSNLAYLSLPTNDLIFRSFLIPQMEKKEITNVIEFEITKYIPLKLQDLVYTYHTVPHIENNLKNLRVLFIAIHRTRLDEMVNAVGHAGLTLQNIEPAPISLMHLLKHQRIISKKGSIAILEIGEESTEIIVFKDEILNFMRKLNVTVDQTDLATLQAALQNEVRVSFNFYNRQNPNNEIDKLIIISQHKIPNIETTLTRDLNIPVTFAPIEQFIPIQDQQSLSHLNALGTTMRKGTFSSKFFDLSEKAIEMQRSGKDPLDTMKRYSTMAGIILCCLLGGFLTIFLSSKMLQNKTAVVAELKNKLGIYESLAASDLTSKKDAIFGSLKNYTNVRTESHLTIILSEIPELLPEGTWLDSLGISYDASSLNSAPKINIALSGKIYSEDPNQQFYLLNELIDRLKKNKKINKYYHKVTRSAANRAAEDKYTITTFTITCNTK